MIKKIFIVSDSTGTTAKQVVEAAMSQFHGKEVEFVVYNNIKDTEGIHKVVKEAFSANAFIVYTIVLPQLRQLMFTEGRNYGVSTFDLFGPLLVRLTELLETEPLFEPGLYKPFDSAYLRRVEAMEFVVSHDDGLSTEELSMADIVLVGVSRTSKTPLSIYLANQGWRVANIPIVAGINPPEELFTLPRRRVVMLTLQPERLAALRQTRSTHLGTTATSYVSIEAIKRELAYAYELLERRPDWPMLDMTAKSIEEAASDVISLLGLQKND
ncbi:MAG: kinase/pyrophosphorylase [Candidatus Magnetoovum sp. WYHC-5]|nr:kinase/pyrophosphorylase [Candidatus Magnetoovum sp. WYHC-5]